MNIKLLSSRAIIPTKAHDTDAGYDLYTVETFELGIGERKAFKTDISIAIPVGLYGRIAPRSGLAFKKGIDVMAGIIDCSYRGEILIILINLGKEPVIINSGDKIAQIIFQPYTNHNFTVVDNLDDTSRGTDGFGSSDVPTEPVISHSSPIFQVSSDIKNNEKVITIIREEPTTPSPLQTLPQPEPEIKSNIIDQYKKHGGSINHPSLYEQKMKEQIRNT